jgi:chromosome segregation ATPase
MMPDGVENVSGLVGMDLARGAPGSEDGRGEQPNGMKRTTHARKNEDGEETAGAKAKRNRTSGANGLASDSSGTDKVRQAPGHTPVKCSPKLQAFLEEWAQESSEAQETKASLAASNRKIVELEDKARTEAKKAEDVWETNKQLAMEKDTLLGENRKLVKDNETLTKSNETLTSQIAELKTQNSALAKKKNDISLLLADVTEERDAAQGKETELSATVAAQLKDIEELKKEKRENERRMLIAKKETALREAREMDEALARMSAASQ